MQKRNLKILAIGNSFSQDAARYLQPMAWYSGQRIKIVNLYIGGCSLESHWNNVQSNARVYDHEINGMAADQKCSIGQALQEDEWDIVTLQQASGDSGMEKSYQPYLRRLSEYVNALAPQAQPWIHQTWAYELDSTHPHFARYDGQIGMYQALCRCYCKAASEIRANIIPVGDVIQSLRAEKPFSFSKGGLSLCRDGFHLSFNYGRYTAAATWLYALTGVLPEKHFQPSEGDPVSQENLELIRKTVYTVCNRTNATRFIQ